MVIHSVSFHPPAYLAYLDGVLNLDADDLARYREALDGGLSLEGLLQRVAKDSGCEVARLGEVEAVTKLEVYGFTAPPES